MPASASECIRRRGRRGRLMLPKKPGKEDGTPTSYRPMCLQNVIRKIYQRIQERRLTEFLEQRRTISGRQCGFRRGKSNVDATLELEKSIDGSESGTDSSDRRQDRHRERVQLHSMEGDQGRAETEYMQQILGSYLSDRRSEYPIAWRARVVPSAEHDAALRRTPRAADGEDGSGSGSVGGNDVEPGGPSYWLRWLYATAVERFVVYGKPVWSEATTRNPNVFGKVATTQKTVAIKTIRGYRTIGVYCEDSDYCRPE
ncbi:UNVERIFIED_CONTAM: hypothetical protein PYX00_006907 [Menopon gallinae]|uniref:Reverse transcriptase domain-containing protein n=1 Tax=Menopon gallinae TaxID=328185 RepID=A0AAW2HGY9_9NEOP